MAVLTQNPTATSSAKQYQVAAGVGLASFHAPNQAGNESGEQVCSVQIKLHANGTLVYKNRFGTTITLSDMGPGPEPIEAQSIETGTDVDVTVYL